MGNAQTEIFDFRPESSFRVLVDGTEAGEFVKAGPLMKGKVDIMAIRGGGSLTPLTKRPGNADFEHVTLERGSSSNALLRLWWEQVCKNGGVVGQNSPTYLRQVRIEQLDRDKTTVLCSWTYDDAFPEEFDMGTMDAESNKFRMEMVKFAYTGTPTYKEGDG